MEKEIYLKEIKHEAIPNVRVCDWEYIESKNRKIRVYYKENEILGSGFVFYGVENTGGKCVPETKNNEWHPEYTHVECVYKGIAYFEGVRHLYMGDEATNNFGYHYCVNLESNIEALKIIRKLEIKYCSECK